MKRGVFALCLTGVLSGCGGSRSAPTTPTPPPAPPPPPPIILSGRASATNGRAPLAGVDVRYNGQTALTDASGTFRLQWPGPAGSNQLTLASDQIVRRTLWLTVLASRDVALDAISMSNGFDLDFYRAFVRNGFEEPERLQPLRRWTQAPRIYLKTVDERGKHISLVTQQMVTRALRDNPSDWTGGRFGIAGIELGTGTREGVSGWITIKWPNPAGDDYCGRAQVGVDGGWIELNYYLPACWCGGTRNRPLTVKHELGHALGFWHTGDRQDLMAGLPRGICNQRPSARERMHAGIAYGRPVGNTDPDQDPSSAATMRSLQSLVVID